MLSELSKSCIKTETAFCRWRNPGAQEEGKLDTSAQVRSLQSVFVVTVPLLLWCRGQNGYSKFQRDWEPYQHYVADKDRGKMSKHTGAKVSQQLNPEGRGWQGYFYKSHRLNNISRRACRWRSRDILTEINTGPRWVLPGLPHSRLTQAGWYVGHGGPNESTCVKAASTAREKAGFSLRFVLDFMVEQLRKGTCLIVGRESR